MNGAEAEQEIPWIGNFHEFVESFQMKCIILSYKKKK